MEDEATGRDWHFFFFFFFMHVLILTIESLAFFIKCSRYCLSLGAGHHSVALNTRLRPDHQTLELPRTAVSNALQQTPSTLQTSSTFMGELGGMEDGCITHWGIWKKMRL